MSQRAPHHKKGTFARVSDSKAMGAFAGERVKIIDVERAEGRVPRPIVAYICMTESGEGVMIAPDFLHTLPPSAQCFRGTIEEES